jgi:hypothetical protein
LRTPRIGLTALMLLLQASPARAADEDLRALVKDLAVEVHRLSGRVVELEKKLAEAEARAKPDAPAAGVSKDAPAVSVSAEPRPVTVGDIKGAYRIPGTDTSLAIGGYAKLDLIYNSVSAGGPGGTNAADQLLQPGQIPLKGEGEHGQVTFHPRESRLWLKTHTPTGWGDLNTYLELDFFAVQAPGLERVTNSYAPGVRHVYGSLGRFLAGQTWTTFMDAGALPELNDFGGPVGRLFVRQPLVRWTEPFRLAGTDADLQFALESPETTLVDAAACTAGNCLLLTPDDDRVPDVVARLDFRPAWGSLAVAGLLRQYRSDEGGEAREAWGGAASLMGRIKGPGLDSLSFTVSWGEGLGRYLYNAVFPDAALDSRGRLVPIEAYGGFLAYQHFWSPAWRSTVAYGYGAADNPRFLPGTLTERVQSAHVNLLWSPLLQTTFGLEYLYALRGLENGSEGDLHRVQFSARYNF